MHFYFLFYFCLLFLNTFCLTFVYNLLLFVLLLFAICYFVLHLFYNTFLLLGLLFSLTLFAFFSRPWGGSGAPGEKVKGKVKNSRKNKLPTNKDDSLFSGEFWSGTQSKELGLVDGLGNMEDIIQEKFGKKVLIKKYDKPESWLKKKLSNKICFVLSQLSVYVSMDFFLSQSRSSLDFFESG